MTITDASIKHLAHVEAGHKGGLSRSPAKVEATRRNAQLARAARAAKIAAKEHELTNGGGQ